MASFSNQLSFFFLLMLFLSPQIQAREGKFFSLFTHFKTIYNAEDHDKAESPAPTPAPFTAPTPAPITAPTQEPAAAPEFGSTIPSGPAPEPEFFDKGEGYGLYGSGSKQYSPTKDTPTTTTTTTTFENELLNEDFNDKSYKTGYPQTNFHNSELYTKNYNSEEYKNNYNNEVYTKNYNSEEYKTNYNNGKEYYKTNYNNGKEYYNNNNYYGNGYERKGEGMSDTRFMENGKYYYNVNSENENYNLNGYEAGRGSTENKGYYEKNQYPNEFDTMEEYEKQQEPQGYTP